MATIEQIRAARAFLGWSQKELADQAGLSQTGIARLENGTHQPNTATLEKIIAAFNQADVEFIDDGVRKVKDRLITFSGKNSMKRLLDDVYVTLEKTKGEVLLMGINELTPEEGELYDYTKIHIERLLDIKATERILIKEGEKEFIAPKSWYREISKEYFSPHTTYIYGTKIALLLRTPHHMVLILDNPFFAESQRAFFNFLWLHAKRVEP